MFKLLTLLLLSSVMFAKIPGVVDVQWLQDKLQDENIVIIDVRPEVEYNKGHLLGAVSIPAMKNLYDKSMLMPKLDALKELLSEAGIDQKSKVAVYGDGKFIRAARLFWILHILGHEDVAILNVGYQNMLSMKTSMQPTVTTRKEFIPRVDNAKLQTKLSTMLAIGEKVIIDGRKETHYLGKESAAKRFGHIPTAQNYSCTNNYKQEVDGNKIKGLHTLKDMYKKFDKDEEIILYCNGGSASALNYVILTELGYLNVFVYDGSWLEWGNDPVVPIVNKSKKN